MVRVAAVAVLLVCGYAKADTEIHRCLLDDGTFAFQELPCAEPTEVSDESADASEGFAPDAANDNDDEPVFVNPFDEPQEPITETEFALPASISKDRAECEKTTRDAIDAIDLQMRQNPYTKKEGQAYLSELRLLTQQLRACKQL